MEPVRTGVTLAHHLYKIHGDKFEVDKVVRLLQNQETTDALKTTDATSVAAQPKLLAPRRAMDTVTRVQVGLAELGYEPGVINGQLGRQTRAAILKFERDRGIAPTGDISPTLIVELEKMSARGPTRAN